MRVDVFSSDLQELLRLAHAHHQFARRVQLQMPLVTRDRCVAEAPSITLADFTRSHLTQFFNSERLGFGQVDYFAGRQVGEKGEPLLDMVALD